MLYISAEIKKKYYNASQLAIASHHTHTEYCCDIKRVSLVVFQNHFISLVFNENNTPHYSYHNNEIITTTVATIIVTRIPIIYEWQCMCVRCTLLLSSIYSIADIITRT